MERKRHPGTRRATRSVGIATGCIAVVTLVLGGPTSAASVLPPYKGGITPTSYLQTQGCEKARVAKLPGFHLKNGTGSIGLAEAAARTCRLAPLFSESIASVDPGVTVAVQLKVGSGSHNVTPAISAVVAENGSVVAHRACPSATFSDRSFANDTAAFGYQYEVWQNRSGHSGTCVVSAVSEVFVVAWLYDATNRTYVPIASSKGCQSVSANECYATFGFVEVYNASTIAWGYVTDQTVLDRGSWTYTNSSCANCNSSSASSASSYRSTAAVKQSPTFQTTFNASHRYFLEVQVYEFANAASEGWPAGAATAVTNGATGGNGFSIAKISIT